MSRLVFCLMFCLSSFVLAQQPHNRVPHQQIDPSAPSSAVQVVYVLNGSTLTTYNINPQTLQATQVGMFGLPQSAFPGFMSFSPDGRFLYYSVLPTGQQGTDLYTYATSASGLPQAPPVQKLNASALFSGPVFDPNAPFAYAVIEGTQGPQYTAYFLKRFSFDETTGLLSQPQTEATYELPSEGGGDQTCGLLLPGMNPAGSELYDEISCENHEGTSATYNERAIDSQTGALGPDAHIYTASGDFGDGSYNVQIANNLMFNFEQGYQYPPIQNFVDVYQVQPNEKTPVAQCTGSQMQACADFAVGLAHPSGQYVFLTDLDNVTDIGQVDLNAHDITGPVSSIPYQVQEFSPDGSIAYGINDVDNALEIQIYGFNVSTGAVTQGGTINVPLDYDPWWTAERY